MSAQGDDDLDLVLAAREGDDSAFGALFDRWFDRVFDVSYRVLRDRDLAAETAQDVFLVAWQQLGDLRQPGSFGGWLLRMSRNRSLNRLERERRSVALGDEETGAVIDMRAPTPDASGQVDDAEQAELLWAAAAALGERDASVLDLHLRHGFGAPEIAEALDVSTTNAYQLLHRLKDRLGTAIRGWVLWHHGEPACEVLTSVLGAAGIQTFGADTVRVIGRHAKGCETCEERQATRLAPEAMFAAVPIVAVGPFLKGKAAAALEGQGVPMSGSTAIAGSSGGASAARRWTRRGLKSAVLVGAAAVVVLAAVTALAGSLGEGTGDVAAPGSTTTTDRPGTSTTGEGTTTSGSSTDTTGATDSTSSVDTTVVGDPPPPSAVPPVVVDPSGQTTTTGRPSSPPPPPGDDPPPAPAPEVLSFVVRSTSPSRTCGSAEDLVTYSWRTANADEAYVGWSYDGQTGRTGRLAPFGTTTACVPLESPGGPPRSFVLTAVGPGGTTNSPPT
jgi:RNA polymerase sigma factor (sigma-70 family)